MGSVRKDLLTSTRASDEATAQRVAELRDELETVKADKAKPRTYREMVLRDKETGLYAGKEVVEV